MKGTYIFWTIVIYLTGSILNYIILKTIEKKSDEPMSVTDKVTFEFVIGLSVIFSWLGTATILLSILTSIAGDFIDKIFKFKK